MKPTLESISRDSEHGCRFWSTQLLDVTEQDYLAMKWVELSKCIRKEAGPSLRAESLFGTKTNVRQVFIYCVENVGRPALAFNQAKALTPDDGEEPARNRRG